jgi:predicted RNA binding protein YcfA (HicA-like mRNA interferase family)
VARLPQVSGQRLIRFLERLGYTAIRRKGSHVRLRKTTRSGEHNLTVPDHRTIAKGTLNDILSSVSLWNGIPKEELIGRLRERDYRA